MFQRSRNQSWRTSRPRVEQLEDRCLPAPVITALNAALTTAVGRTVQVTGSFTDSVANDPESVIINWNDGSASQTVPLAVGARDFQVTHVYAKRATAIAAIPAIGVIMSNQAFASQVVAETGNFNGGPFQQLQTPGPGRPHAFHQPFEPLRRCRHAVQPGLRRR